VSQEFIIGLTREFFWTILLVGGPVLIVSLLVGLIISIFQAATSIQEFTLTFVPKLIAIAIVLFLTTPWVINVMVTFTRNLYNQIPNIAH